MGKHLYRVFHKELQKPLYIHSSSTNMGAVATQMSKKYSKQYGRFIWIDAKKITKEERK